jgi:hypothetical protein
MTFVCGSRLKGLTLCLTGGLAALPLVFAGSLAAQAQFGDPMPRVVLPPPQPPVQQPYQPPQLPPTLSPSTPTVPSAPQAVQPQAAPAAAAAPARRSN